MNGGVYAHALETPNWSVLDECSIKLQEQLLSKLYCFLNFVTKFPVFERWIFEVVKY